MSIHQPPLSASPPLPPYHSRSAPVMIELISDSEEEEGSVVEVSGATLTHQVCYFFFFLNATHSPSNSSSNRFKSSVAIGPEMVSLNCQL